MNKIIWIFSALIINFLTIDTKATIIWEESFSTPEKGYWGDSDGVTVHSDFTGINNWFLDASSCTLSAESDYLKTTSTSGGRFEVVDSDGEAIWSSEWIDISNFKDVNIQLNVAETGSGNNYENKYVKLYYEIEGHSAAEFETNGNNEGNFGSLVASQSNLQGNKVRIIAKLKTNYSSDKLILDEIQVSGESNIVLTANQTQIIYCPPIVYKNHPFTIKAQALCSNNSVDINYNSPLSLSETTGLLDIPLIQQTPSQTIYTWNNLSFSDTGKYTIQIFNSELTGSSTTIECEEYFEPSIKVDFEDSNKSDWTPNNHWELDAGNTINGNYSLKHQAIEDETESFSFYEINKGINAANYRWSVSIKNGDWNPSSSNKFWYYLAADKNDPDQLNGWAVGVNINGSEDQLELWRFKDGSPDSLIIQSNFIWAENTLAKIELERNINGQWLFWIRQSNGLKTYKASGKDKSSIDFNYWGIYFKYTSTRAGQLWFDDFELIEIPVAPFIQEIYAINENQIKLLFNKPINESSINTANIKLLANTGSEIKINDFELYESTITLKIDTPGSYNLNLISKEIEDMNGLQMTPDTIDFEFVLPCQNHSLVITEIMADPNPTEGLPEVEYLELYNRYSFPISLNNLKLRVDEKEVELNYDILYPSEYLLLTSEPDYFEESANTIEINLPTLRNSGAKIQIQTTNGEIIDEINYSSQWYQDDDKRNGGWSLERIDANRFCNQSENWKASENSQGGTPGTINSIAGENLDNQAPQLSSFNIPNQNIIVLSFSEEINFEQLTNENFTILETSDNPDSISNPENNLIHLVFNNSFESKQNYHLEISGILDRCDNISPTFQKEFNFYIPEQYSIIINEIFADPYPSVGLPEYEFIELYNRMNFDINLGQLTLNIQDKSITLPDSIIPANSYQIICSSEGAGYYENAIGITGFPSLKNSDAQINISGNNDQIIDEIEYNYEWHEYTKQNGGWTLERIDRERFCNQTENWTSSVAQIGGTPGLQNSVAGTNIDNSIPEIQTVEVINNHTLNVYFSEPIDSSLITDNSTFFIKENKWIPELVSIITNQSIQLTFGEEFSSESEYRLGINSLTDLCGNTSQNLMMKFVYFQPSLHSLVISEIYADPYPAEGLPEYEYVEIYNRAEFPILLKNVTLEISEKSYSLPNVTIQANDYATLTTPEAVALYDKVVGIKSFPSLRNGEGNIKLKYDENILLDEINYTDEWYQDAQKQDGGWSLERIDVNRFCGQSGNWLASINKLGGTPGNENSVSKENEDNTSPIIINSEIISSSELLIEFSEDINYEALSDINNYFIKDLSEPSKLTIQNQKEVILNFNTNFELDKTYSLQLSNITDECGNPLKNNIAEFQNLTIDKSDILISEVLFNPYPGGEDFVEIYNNSDKEIPLRKLFIGTRNVTGEIENYYQISELSRKILPEDYLVCTKDSQDVTIFYQSENNCFVNMNKLPSFNDDEGCVVLLNDSLEIIDEFSYSKQMHHPLLNDVEGVSLERMSFLGISNDASNWHSAAASVGFATPGYKNSQERLEVEITEPIVVSPEVFSPNNDGFNDRLNIHYELEKPGYSANVKVYDSLGRLVNHIIKNQTLAQNGEWFWDGVKPDNSRSSLGIYILLIELFDQDGNVKKYRKTCTLTDRL